MGLKDSLVRRGYIPTELIPPFKSESLADALPSLATDFSTCGKSASKCCYHSIPKLKHFRRLIALPSPLHQTILAQTLETHWGDIEPAVVRCTDWAALAFPSHPLSSPSVPHHLYRGAEI
jgi:hypothetical protein